MTAQRSRRPKTGGRGADGAQGVTGRKRHLLVDTLSLILVVVVPAAALQDDDGAKLVVERMQGWFRRPRQVWAGGIDERIVGEVARWRPAWPIRLEIIKRTEPGFKVLKRSGAG
ncbi:MAG: hypothetical protein IRY99_09815 [Isosphaeraceae bacterium]|nr:hypothetical protein [Isosphaeraceae bacterium]